MKLTCLNFDSLLSTLVEVSGVVEDASANENTKNILFQIKPLEGGHAVTIMGISPTLTYKKTVDSSDVSVELTEEETSQDRLLMQFKSKDLISFLNSYKTLRKTKVDSVSFEVDKNKIRCVVYESNVFSEREEEYLRMQGTYEDMCSKIIRSQWMFDFIPVLPKLNDYINLSVPQEGLVEVESNIIKFYTSSLLPVMENGNSLYSMLQFDDNVVAFNKAFNTVMLNSDKLKTVFNGFRLNYKAVSFIDKVICSSEVVSIAKTEKHLVFKTPTSETYILYNTELANYQASLSSVSKNAYFKIDRIYLKDVLKRLSLSNDAIEVKVNTVDGVLTLSNPKFSQDIAILGQVGMDNIANLSFSVMPSALNMAIIGDDNLFTSGDDMEAGYTYVLYNPLSDNKTAGICFSDRMSKWFSILRVKIRGII